MIQRLFFAPLLSATVFVALLVFGAKAESAWAQYVDPASGLGFMYPAGWGVERAPEPDCLVKVTGTGRDAYFGEMKLLVFQDAASPEQVADIAEVTMFKQIPGYKKIARIDTKFGRRAQFPGTACDIAVTMGDLRLRQQYNWFRHNDRTYAVVFTAPENSYARDLPVFKQILSTIDAAPQTRAQHPSSAATREHWKLRPLEETHTTPIKMYYPEGWRVTRENQGEETGWKIVGKNRDGHDAELHLWIMPRGDFSTEQLTELAEQEHLKPLPHYKKVSTGTKTFGTPRIDGIAQVSTFVAEGLPGKMHSLFFSDRDRFYCLSMLSVAWTQDEMRDLLDKVASSVKLTQ